MHHNWVKRLRGTKLFDFAVAVHDPEVNKIQTDPSPEQSADPDATAESGLERQGTVTTPERPAAERQTRQQPVNDAVVLLNLPSRDVRGLAPSPPPSCQTLNIMREAVIAEASTQLSEVVGVDRAPSRTDVAGRIFVLDRVDGGLKPHSDIDLLVTARV